MDVPKLDFGPGLLAPGQEFDDGFLDETGGGDTTVEREDLYAADDVRLDVDEELLPGRALAVRSIVFDQRTHSS